MTVTFTKWVLTSKSYTGSTLSRGSVDYGSGDEKEDGGSEGRTSREGVKVQK